ncbi:hypothetical protein ABB55_22670 [Prosthecomicrobium hirschii]|uniref:Type I-U CRISPR-associated protein Cas5/Cas6 n=1 Tax=Prosthecodimorpha hirschii TaxID=665126 RepID=A0A0P6VSK0_9HYPH|nr:type I-U CRISPR-associated protein Csb2 [Prosthecomicrobium hirschii]KPL54682.1 hypothetical protein ABB55_22670 [Prosthecomicrobium hirschii]
MTLVLEIEHLTGVAFAAVGPDSDAPDWPPQPDRVFSALVASWAARGRREDERRALEWLERQDPPEIVASDAVARTAPVSFVPPNDPQTRKSADRSVMPAYRRRQPRRFPAARPTDAVVRLVWGCSVSDGELLSALDALAAATAYIGHSASLTRCRFRDDAGSTDCDRRTSAARRVYPGRLGELERAFADGRRPSPGARIGARPQPAERPPQGVFSPDWLVLEHVDGPMPDIRAAAMVAKAIRDALLDGYGRLGEHGDRIPSVVSGHAADGAPSRDPHLAIVPLAFAGFPHADGQVLGFALVPPRGSGILDDATFRRAVGTLCYDDEDSGRLVLDIASRSADPGPSATGAPFRLRFSPTFEPDRRSLQSWRYRGPAQNYASVTPLVLDRHTKQRGDDLVAEVAASIAAACRNIGLPEPVLVVPDKHSAVDGVVSAWPSGRAPSWTRWRLPPALASRPLTHAVLHFDVPVEGPLILGAGRFLGMGLCLPIGSKEMVR